MIPKTILIAGKPYVVTKLVDSDLMGECNNVSMSIKYSPSQHEEQLKDTILHECLHAIDYAVQLEMTERQVHTLAAMLLLFFKQNKKLTDWLLS